MNSQQSSDFDSFAYASMPRLRRLAYVWCRDWHRADDLVQGALERVYVAWPRLRAADDPFAYARTTMLHVMVSETRRPWWRREIAQRDLPESTIPQADFDSRLDVLDAVGRLPPRQRLVVLLRYIEDLSVSEVARLLDCSEGTVKSQTHDAMNSLRQRCASDVAATQILPGADL